MTIGNIIIIILFTTLSNELEHIVYTCTVLRKLSKRFPHVAEHHSFTLHLNSQRLFTFERHTVMWCVARVRQRPILSRTLKINITHYVI